VSLATEPPLVASGSAQARRPARFGLWAGTRFALGAGLLGLLAGAAFAQRPSIPPQPIAGPALQVTPIEQAQALELPAGLALGQVASVAVDGRGHLYVLNRGDPALLEFDGRGRFVRGLAGGLFERAHGLTLDPAGGFWVTDVAAHVVMRLDADGRVTMMLGTRGQSGVWDEAAGKHVFDEPNDVAIGPDGSVFVAQGHGRGEPMILKFDPEGRFLKSWGGRGTLPWQLAVAHSIVIRDGMLYVADRENRRISVFDLDGEFVKGWVYRGMACSLALSGRHIFMTTGFDGQIVELDFDGHVLGVTGRPGEGSNEYGEAHDIAVAGDAIYVADVVNRRVQKLLLR
jgi:DNA-binding beta-propeller fold protein YncE